MILAVLPHRIAGSARERKPDFGRSRRKHLRRHYPEDGVGLVAEIDRLPEHVRLARENALPKLVADHANRRAADAILLFRENATELRLKADDLEKVSGHQPAWHLFRRTPG